MQSQSVPVVLTGQESSIEIDLSQGTLNVGSITPPLTLADYTVPTGYETSVLALIEAERDGSDFVFRTDGTPIGTLSDGELVIDDLDATLSRIRDRAGDGSTLQLNSEGADDIGVAFSTGGSYAGGIWDIQTAGDSFSLDLNVLTFGNATQLRYAVPAAGQSVLAGIATGDLFIIALRIPEAADPVVLTGQEITVEIDLSRGALNVGAAPPVAPVVLTGQETSIEIDLSRGTLNVGSTTPPLVSDVANPHEVNILVRIGLDSGTKYYARSDVIGDNFYEGRVVGVESISREISVLPRDIRISELVVSLDNTDQALSGLAASETFLQRDLTILMGVLGSGESNYEVRAKGKIYRAFFRQNVFEIRAADELYFNLDERLAGARINAEYFPDLPEGFEEALVPLVIGDPGLRLPATLIDSWGKQVRVGAGANTGPGPLSHRRRRGRDGHRIRRDLCPPVLRRAGAHLGRACILRYPREPAEYRPWQRRR